MDTFKPQETAAAGLGNPAWGGGPTGVCSARRAEVGPGNEQGGPARTRTWDRRIMSPLL